MSRAIALSACHDMILQLLRSQNPLMDRLSLLEEKVNLNSRKSSKPPSSDGRGRPPAFATVSDRCRR